MDINYRVISIILGFVVSAFFSSALLFFQFKTNVYFMTIYSENVRNKPKETVKESSPYKTYWRCMNPPCNESINPELRKS